MRRPSVATVPHPAAGAPARVGRRAPLLPALALIVAVAACGPPEPSLVVDRVHDLYARFGEAAVESGGVAEDPPVLLFRLVYLDNKVDDRDGIASLHAPARTTITWRDLPVRGTPVLTFGCGVVPLLNAPVPAPVVFRVEGRDESAADPAFTVLFEETLAPGDLPDVAAVRRREVTLPGGGDARWTLRFTTERADAADPTPVDWPGWFEPLLRSDGRAVEGTRAPVVVRAVHADLVATLDEAEVLEQRDGEPVAVGSLDAALDVPVFGGRRTVVSAAPPSRVRWSLDVPDDAVLDFAVGMDSERGWKLPGDGMTFSVEVDGERVWERALRPQVEDNDRGWQLGAVPLDRWAGRTVSLDLVTTAGDDPRNDVGGWANLRVLGTTRARRLARGEKPNVLVLLMDTLRADRFGCYGNANDLTPRMDSVAARGVRFDRARTVASYTWPSTASLFTGLYPHAHGVLGNGQAVLVDRVETMAELFSAAGYTTGAFVANPLISRAGNFQQGFETFVNAPSVRARALNERVLHWLDGREEAALLTYVHYFDPHNPYNAPPGHEPDDLRPDYAQRDIASVPHLERTYADVTWDGKQIRDFQLQNNGNRRDYDAEVLYQDAAVGELLDAFAERGLLDDTLVVLMSDHGEEFFEHGRPFHGPNLYDESLFIPMILAGYGPSALEPDVVERPVLITDVLPTLCDLAGVPRPRDELAGVSLLDGRRDEPLYFLSMNGEEVGIEGMTEKLAILAPPWKLVRTPASGRVELYRLDVDPGELDDLAEREPRVRDRLLERLDAWLTEAVADGAEGAGVSEEQRWFLEQLGYMDGGK